MRGFDTFINTLNLTSIYFDLDFTSSIAITEIGEPPYIPQADAVSNVGQQYLTVTRPGSAFYLLFSAHVGFLEKTTVKIVTHILRIKSSHSY